MFIQRTEQSAKPAGLSARSLESGKDFWFVTQDFVALISSSCSNEIWRNYPEGFADRLTKMRTQGLSPQNSSN
jgi:hypothetical protein